MLAVRNGMYQQAKQNIDQGILQLENLKVLRPEDQEYIDNKINQMYSTLDNMGDKDLSRGNVADSYYSAIKSVGSDPIVADAVGNTMRVSRFNSEIQKLTEKKPELVKSGNVSFALDQAGYNAYMAGETNSIKEIRYTPYTDYNKKMEDRLNSFSKMKPKQTIEVLDGMGGKKTVTKEGLTAEDLRSIVTNSLDNDDLSQMQIDAWVSTGGFKNTAVIGELSSYLKDSEDKLNSKKISLEKQIKEGGSTKQIEKWNSDLNFVNGQLGGIDQAKSSTINAATYLQREKVVNGFVDMYSPLYTESVSYDTDKLYWDRANYDLNVKKFEFEQDKEKQKGIEGLQTITTATPTVDEIGSVINQFDTTTTEIKTGLDGTLSVYKSEIERLANSGDKDAKNLLAQYNTKLKTKGTGITDLDVFRETVLGNVTNKDSSLAVIQTENGIINFLADVKAGTDNYKARLDAKAEYIKERDSEHILNTLDNQSTFSAFNSNSDTKMLFNGRAVSVAQVLKQRGLMSPDGKKIGNLTDPKNKDILDELKKSYYADAILSKSGIGGVNEGYVKELATMLGEDSSNIVEAKSYQVRTGDGTQTRSMNVVKSGTKTAQYIEKARQSGIYDTLEWADNSLSNDDATIGRFINNSDYKGSERALGALKKYSDKLAENKVIGVPTTSTALYNDLTSYATSVANSNGSYFKIDKNQGLNIRNIDKDYVEISQNASVDNTTTPQKVRVLKRDLYSNFPQIKDKVDFDNTRQTLTPENLAGKVLKSESISFVSASNPTRFEWISEVLLDTPSKQNLLPFVTGEDTKRTLKTSFSMLNQQMDNFYPLVDRVVNESGDYAINMEVIKGARVPKIAIKMVETSTGNVIHTKTMEANSGLSLDDLKGMIDNAPQLIYGEILSDIFRRQTESVQYNSHDDSFVRLVNSLNN